MKDYRKIIALILIAILIFSNFGGNLTFANDVNDQGISVTQEVYSEQGNSADEEPIVTIPPIAEANPSLSVSIKTEEDRYMQGQTVNYTATVINDGDTDLYDVKVTDSLSGTNVTIKVLLVGAEEEFIGWYLIDPVFDGDKIEIKVDAEGEYDDTSESVTDSVYGRSRRGGDKGSVSGMDTAEVTVEKLDIPLSFIEFIPNPSTGFVRSEDFEDLNLMTLDKTGSASDIENSSQETRNMSLMTQPIIEEPLMVQTISSEDTIAVDKTATDNGNGIYEINLNITGQPQDVPKDIILVIDSSGSMGDGNPSAMYYAKQAAESFAEQILNANSNNRVAIIDFWWDGHGKGNLKQDTAIRTRWWVGSWWSGHYEYGFTNDQDIVEEAIDDLTAGGGTNTEAGFVRARNLMEESGREDVYKAIVFLTDGLPTISIGNYYGPEVPEEHNVHTIAAYEAGQDAWEIADVFTIGLLNQVPQNSLNLARDTLQRAQNAGYYETMSSVDLSAIYDQINEQMNYSAKNAIVTDVIDSRFSLVTDSIVTSPEAPATYDESTRTITWIPGTIGTNAQLTYRVMAKCGVAGGTNIPTNEWARLDYTDVNGNQASKDFPVPTVNVQPPLSVDAGTDREIVIEDVIGIGDHLVVSYGYPDYSYKWTNENDPSWSSNERNPQVSPTEDTRYTVTVTDSHGCTATDSLLVTVKKGSLIISKVVENENTTKEFIVRIEGPDGKKWNIFIHDGETKRIEGLWLGTYRISETVPMDYELVGISSETVNITRNHLTEEVTVTNRRSNNGWFRDDDEKVNRLTVMSFSSASTSQDGEESEAGLIQNILEAVLPNKQEDGSGDDIE